MIKNSTNKILIFFFSLTMQSCLDLRSCDKELSEKYYCNHEKDSVNYLELKKNGTYYHYYKKGEVELANEGSWTKSNDGYCKIELKGWKNFNEKGVDYENFMLGLLFVNGDYLDISPDGESSTSFKKK